MTKLYPLLKIGRFHQFGKYYLVVLVSLKKCKFSRLSDTDTENTILKSIEIFEKKFFISISRISIRKANKLIKEKSRFLQTQKTLVKIYIYMG
jgi:hypothetical protein